jgi:hypothetical protein
VYGLRCCGADGVRRVEGTYYLHLQGRKVRAEASDKLSSELQPTAVRTSNATRFGRIGIVPKRVRYLQTEAATREAGPDVTESRT